MIRFLVATCNMDRFFKFYYPHWNVGKLSPLGLVNLTATISPRMKVVHMNMPPTRKRKGKVTVSKPSCSAGTIEKSSKPCLDRQFLRLIYQIVNILNTFYLAEEIFYLVGPFVPNSVL